MRKTVYIFLCLLLSVIVAGCNNNTISRSKFVSVYCDLTIAKDTLTQDDFKKQKTGILAKYGVTEKQLKTTYDYYYQNPTLWKPFFDEALVYMNKKMPQRNGQVKTF